MNLLTHISIGKVIYQEISDISPINKKAFLLGNVLPDISPKYKIEAHMLEFQLKNVCNYSHHLVENPVSDYEFSIRLGSINHFVCDFFCLYHLNETLLHRKKDHFIYELNLHRSFMEMDSFKLQEYFCNTDINTLLTSFRNSYESEIPNCKNDINFAISASLAVCKQIAYCRAIPHKSEIATI